MLIISLLLPLMVILDSQYQTLSFQLGNMEFAFDTLLIVTEGAIVSPLLSRLVSKIKSADHPLKPVLWTGLLWLVNAVFLNAALLMSSSVNSTLLVMLDLFSLLLMAGTLLPAASGLSLAMLFASRGLDKPLMK